MNSVYFLYAWRFLLLGLFQVLVLMNMPFGQINVYIYPLAILFLPLEIPTMVLMVIGFFYGLFMDMFYNTAGLHASALVILAFCKNWLAFKMSPRADFDLTKTINKNLYGIGWFLQFSLLMLAIHIIWIISLEEFSFGLVWILRVVLSFILSAILWLIYQFIFNPK
jgi:hypothetical protein